MEHVRHFLNLFFLFRIQMCIRDRDEYEAIRLIDFIGMTQEGCAESMKISRPTVTNIYESARHKLADALINEKILLIDCLLYTSACLVLVDQLLRIRRLVLVAADDLERFIAICLCQQQVSFHTVDVFTAARHGVGKGHAVIDIHNRIDGSQMIFLGDPLHQSFDGTSGSFFRLELHVSFPPHFDDFVVRKVFFRQERCV